MTYINSSLEAQTFYLLHLSLLREYLNLEFQSIVPLLSFPYSLERVIDDFVLLAVFVGNDFLPNLPDLHIHENGLERLFQIYKKVVVKMGGCLFLLVFLIICFPSSHLPRLRSILSFALFRYLLFYHHRWLHQRSWASEHTAASTSPGRDGLLGTRSVRAGVCRCELV